MIDFPASTFYNRTIPKKKFYDKLDVTQKVKDIFVNEISSIVWRNKLSEETFNIVKGSRVNEIQVFEITLKKRTFNEQSLKLIDKGIPYYLLFLLRYESSYMACMGYKEFNKEKSDALVVKEYFKTDWMTFEELPLHLDGLTLDEVHDHFIVQINQRLNITLEGNLKDAIHLELEQRQKEQLIERLTKKMFSEKQPKRKFEKSQEIQSLRKKYQIPKERIKS